MSDSKYGDYPPELIQAAKELVRQRYSVDPDLPGWYGLVKYAIYELEANKYDLFQRC